MFLTVVLLSGVITTFCLPVMQVAALRSHLSCPHLLGVSDRPTSHLCPCAAIKWEITGCSLPVSCGVTWVSGVYCVPQEVIWRTWHYSIIAWLASSADAVAQGLNWPTRKLCLDPQPSGFPDRRWKGFVWRWVQLKGKPVSEVEVNAEKCNIFDVK